MTLTPFADDAASVSIGKLTIENGTDRVALYGSLDITRDQQGLVHARALLAILQACWRTRTLRARQETTDRLVLMHGRIR